MALTLHIVPTGESIRATGQPSTSLGSLHSWVAKAAQIKETDQIILTNKGKHVQEQTLLTEVYLRHGDVVEMRRLMCLE